MGTISSPVTRIRWPDHHGIDAMSCDRERLKGVEIRAMSQAMHLPCGTETSLICWHAQGLGIGTTPDFTLLQIVAKISGGTPPG